MLDPDADPAPVFNAFDYVMRSRNVGLAPYTQEELLRIAASGKPAAKGRVGRLLNTRLPPQGEEIELRRETWNATPASERWDQLGWFVLCPVGNEDLEIIRSAFEIDPWRASMITGRELKYSPQAVHELILSLCEHPDPRIRRGAVMSFEDWMRERNNKPPIEVQNAVFLVATQDADVRVSDYADRFLENLSPEFGPRLGEAIAATVHPARFEGLLHSATRKDDPGVLPGLSDAAMQADRPLWQRAKAARGYARIHSRTRQTSAMPDFSGVYGMVIDSLIEGDAELLLRIGQDETFAWDEQVLLVIPGRAETEGVQPGALSQWFDARPALAAVLMLAEPAEPSARDALGYLIHMALQRPAVDTRLADALATWFPERLPRQQGD